MDNSNRQSCHRSIVSIDHVSFSYEHKKVIEKLRFDVLERDFVGVIGSNGAGKTTLLKMLVGLLKPTEGEIRLFDRPINQFKDWERIGYVPQKNAFNPLFPATVREIVLSGMYSKKHVYRRLSKADVQKAEDAMLAMRIEDLANRRIGQLSGGQQQRAFLARAIVNNPELLILDEPTVGIDAETQVGFFRMIRHMHQHHHMAFIMVSHDMDMMQSYLGTEPQQMSGGIKFYVKHTHDPEDCRETNLTHSIGQIREMIGVQ
ncbi:metal ABC transporter ATP-binding protein [Paenibacillus sp. SYP-B3998]|uniref:Metal ABC transporter ATP-binding protein n=1 Tax=Paenibacillus sp. SYP-B3998 TaxID=2678564 RepID=A0A6G3ZXC6_9BACL|nr:metal ABC transporter ATP-binding protein [Paenibacillus sp. SYP-B3998]NEW06239.1 metal ABC transporter ATP-binding protein [Paenibacillus sp. SYP-B3998]